MLGGADPSTSQGRFMTVERKLMTADELLHRPDDGFRHELVQGELLTMSPTGFEHGDVTLEIGGSLRGHARAHHLGTVVTDVGFLLTTDPDTVRAPDIAFVRAERLHGLGQVRGYWLGAPDLAVEVISPNDLYTEIEKKVAEYLQHGTRVVFVLNPRRRTVAVHRPDQPIRSLSEGDTLAAEDVIPGWSIPVHALFDQPQ